MSEIDDYLNWREQERKKHRVMTTYEYRMWLRGGDTISYPTDGNAFPGGITIKFERAPFIIGAATPD